jgi:hypothetical protein
MKEFGSVFVRPVESPGGRLSQESGGGFRQDRLGERPGIEPELADRRRRADEAE